jgi:hypothetical protein
VGDMGSAFGELMNSNPPNELRDRFTSVIQLENTLIQNLEEVEKSLGYSFNNKRLLLEAFTHKSFREYHGLTNNHYETLEVLGDAILDYVANSNLIKYTILEKYNVEERLA